MKRKQLFRRLQTWLEREGIVGEGNSANRALTFQMAGTSGQWSCCLVCEEKPSMVQIICRLPVLVPESKLVDVALLLHQLNRRIRVGSFGLRAPGGVVAFRLPTLIQPGAELDDQLAQSFHMAMGTFNDAFNVLCAFVASDAETLRRLAKLAPTPQPANDLELKTACHRPELN